MLPEVGRTSDSERLVNQYLLDHPDQFVATLFGITLQDAVVDEPSSQLQVRPRVPDTVSAVIIVLFHLTEQA